LTLGQISRADYKTRLSGEIGLKTYAHFADRDPLTRVVLEQMLAAFRRAGPRAPASRSARPSQAPNGLAERDLDAVGSDPQRDDAAAALELDAVEHQRRQPDVAHVAAHQARRCSLVRPTNSRLTADFDTGRRDCVFAAELAASRPRGSASACSFLGP